jgi:hypothetical protein
MQAVCVLFHYGEFEPLWQQTGTRQAGPRMGNGPDCIHVGQPSIETLKAGLLDQGLRPKAVLLHYTDPFLLRSAPLRGLRRWPGPKLLICGDLHHGPDPIGTLAAYLQAEPHDAVLLTFNPALLDAVRQHINVPVRCLPPTFFRYPSAKPIGQTRLELLHVGSLGPYHPVRRDLVTTLQARGRVPFRHATTANAAEAASLYASHALVLNIPLNNDLNHRFFEVMAAGVPQVVFGDPALVGEHRALAERADVFWASSLDELEELVLGLLADPAALRAIPVAPPPYWHLKTLLKAAFAP